MFRRSGYRFADKNMRQSITSRAWPDSEGTGQALVSRFRSPLKFVAHSDANFGIEGHSIRFVSENDPSAYGPLWSEAEILRLSRKDPLCSRKRTFSRPASAPAAAPSWAAACRFPSQAGPPRAPPDGW